MAAPAYRSHATASVNGATLTITKPTGTASGDVLICHIQHVTGNQSIDPTPPSGAWTLIGARQANSSSTQWWFWAAAGGSEPASYDWTGLPSGFQIGSITAVSGADTTTPFHQTHQLQNTNIAGTDVALTVTTTITDCLLWASASLDAGETTTFTQASMTERWDESLLSTFLCHAGYTEDALTTGTYARTITYTPAQRCAGTLLAIAPASAGASMELGLATETDTALGATASKTATLGQATETDTALGATAAKAMTMGLATETDTALAVTATKSASLDLATEVDSALGITASKVYTLGLATETDEALGMTSGASASFEFSLATETDAALGVTAAKAVTLGLATEVDLALGFTAVKVLTLGLATETDSALSFAPTKLAPLGLATETSTALAITAAKAYPLGLATEVDEALAIVSAGPYTPALLPTATTRAQATATTRDLNGAATTRETA